MEILDDRFLIGRVPRDAQGNPVEPEAQPVRRVLTVQGLPIRMSDASKPGAPYGNAGAIEGQISTSIAVEMNAAEAAQGMRSPCLACKNFDQPGWHRMLKQLQSTADGMRALNRWRAALVVTRNAAIRDNHEGQDGEIDVEHALMACGLCRPMTEIASAAEKANIPMVVYPAGHCPDVIPGTEEWGPEKGGPVAFPYSFVPRDTETEKITDATYDSIMQAAQGRPK